MNIRVQPRPAAMIGFLAALLGIELIGELVLVEQAAMVRAFVTWSMLILATIPPLALLSWRTSLADREFVKRRSADRMRALVSQLASEPDPARVPRLLTEQLRELSGAQLAFLAQPGQDGYRVTVVAGDDSHHLLGQHLPIKPDSAGLAANALREGRPVLLGDTWNDEGLAARREMALSDRVRSCGAVPVILRGEVIGLVGLHATAVNRLNPRQAEVLAGYVEQALGPLENALLLDSVQRMDAARQLDQVKTEFLSAVAHELRAPLTPMLGWAELLLTRSYSPEQARPMLQNIFDGAQHLSVLVGDLLDLARGEAGRLNLELADLDLNAELEASVSRWREQAREHHFVLAAAGPIPLKGDTHRLRQVLDNLLSNAVKYSPAGSRVFITARSESRGRAIIRISDQGIGLTAEEREKLFAKFYRTDTARELTSGTGLGLALCRMIVEAHGGDIRVESDGPGYGCAFSFGLPLTGPMPEAAQPPHAVFAGAR